MKNHLVTYVTIVLFFGINLLFAQHQVLSPDRKIKIILNLRPVEGNDSLQNDLTYTIYHHNQPVVEESCIGIYLKNSLPLGKNLKLVNQFKQSISEVSELPFGKSRLLLNQCNELKLLFTETGASRRTILLTVRAYDDAAAFRLNLPHQRDLKSVIIGEEKTEIQIPGGLCYALPLKHFCTPYENNYKMLTLDNIPFDMLIGLPLLVNIDNGSWLAICEADLHDYPGMYLVRERKPRNTLLSRLAPLVSDSLISARITVPFDFPWRVFMIAENPGKLIESNTILNLCKPSRMENCDWIKPGKVAWPWWSGRVVDGRTFQGGMNTATMKYYIDFAAEAGLEYLLIDAEWYGKHDTAEEDITSPIPDVDLPEIISYANSRGVGIFLWLNWQCVRDQMQTAFPLYEKWGIKGIKVDYMNRDDQEMVNFYREVVDLAAHYHLMVNFHGAYKPTGLRRTYPNLITREGVLGLEWCKWSEKCNPDHELILPFTRMLAGPMDFTPGTFHVGNRNTFKIQFTNPMAMGTRAHQLAMYVVYESPLQMVVGHPASFFGQIGFEFIKQVPTVWDETKFIAGEVGEYIALARRKGKEWYLGCMIDWKERSLDISLSFLGGEWYMAHIYRDGSGASNDPTRVTAELLEVRGSDVLRVNMLPGGGTAVRFVPTWMP